MRVLLLLCHMPGLDDVAPARPAVLRGQRILLALLALLPLYPVGDADPAVELTLRPCRS
jgi:hypothetical protein